jgi:MoxR-like ATPase
LKAFKPKIDEIISTLSYFLHGKEKPLKLSLIAFFSRGHLLIEDLPGLGKTTLAIGISKILGLDFGRIQCTSDLLPTDITGVSVYNKSIEKFEFHPGPIFNNIVLVDEINRATPKTQSALLEAMGEKQVTAEGETYKLPKPFFVIATQNPLEEYGTFPLPESQLDRFIMKISVGYPTREAEKEILKGGSKREELYTLKPVMTKEEVLSLQKIIEKDVYVSEKIYDYILDIVELTRTSRYFYTGLSIRGSLAVLRTAKTRAVFEGRDYVIPEDIKELIPYTIPHRVKIREELDDINKTEFIKSLIDQIRVPV